MNETVDKKETDMTEEYSYNRSPKDLFPMNEYRAMNRFMLFIILMALIPWLFGSKQILTFNVTGWSWVISASLAALICLARLGQITFPLIIWLPWILMLTIYWYYGQDNPNATQSFLQMLSPIAVGCAASIFRPDNLQLENIIHWITRMAWVCWALMIIRLPMLLTGMIPDFAFLAPEMIGLLLLGACYSSFYACGSSMHLYYYLAMLAATIIALVRGPIVAMLSCMPLTVAPLTFSKRIILCVILIFCALVVFNTERVQKKMFSSGRGELSDVRWGNPQLKTHGRTAMWETLWDGVKKEPWLGNGWNFHRVTLLRSGSELYLPHNDWLKLLYDLGIVGIGLYLLTMIIQLFSLVKIAQASSGAHQMLAYGVATTFIPYALIMLTDNVVLYVQFFGNLHFALIGIVYGYMYQDSHYEYV